DLVSAQNTGVFMDMREVRDRMVSFYPQIDSVLNLFCYTGAFSVHALAHGVPRAVNVDISAPVLDRARTNYTLNGLACDDRDFVRTDVMKAIRRFSKQGQRFGLVILDPPTFSRNKHSHFSVKKDYMRCCRLLEELTPAYVLSAMNTYSVPLSGYLSSHPQHWERIFLMHESTDFPHGNDPYLKCALWRVHDRHYG
ncbi:MAG: class I SAM-dependent methyltransferase, partial [Spirochaetota bacterium]